MSLRSPKRSPGRSTKQKQQSPARSMGTTVRRLSDEGVRAIFECLHHQTPPPPDLKFQIVPVGPTGLKLSPPSHEFPDGLYVLLRPQKKRKNQIDRPKAPDHLTHLVTNELPPDTCPWSLSGPQFPQPTAIQQRYCYPKGRPEYSSRKGGALWTMYGADGKEDLEFRLLHVYFSAKRAVNKGVAIPDEELLAASQQQSTPPAAKRFKRISRGSMTPRRKSLPLQQPHHHQSPAITASTVNSSSLCSSPLSFDILPPPSPASFLSLNGMPTEQSLQQQPSNFVTPDLFRRFPPEATPNAGTLTPSPFRRTGQQAHHNIQQSPLQRSMLRNAGAAEDDNRSDPFPVDMDASWQEIDSYWNDPLLNIMLKPSMEVAGHDNDSSDDDNKSLEPVVHSFGARLGTLHESIRERILAAPVQEQPGLVNLVASWARQVAKDPLTNLQQQQQQQLVPRGATGRNNDNAGDKNNAPNKNSDYNNEDDDESDGSLATAQV